MSRTGLVEAKRIGIPVGFQSGVERILQNVFLQSLLHKSTPPQIRQLISCYYSYKEQVDEFVREMTSAK